jgi:hypothetical protein
MRDPLDAQDLFHEHLIPLGTACFFIWIFVVSVPVIYFMHLSPDTELLLFTLLFAVCHLANWPMLRLRSRLWFEGRLTPAAAMVTTALLAGSFGIPFILLVDMIS